MIGVQATVMTMMAVMPVTGVAGVARMARFGAELVSVFRTECARSGIPIVARVRANRERIRVVAFSGKGVVTEIGTTAGQDAQCRGERGVAHRELTIRRTHDKFPLLSCFRSETNETFRFTA